MSNNTAVEMLTPEDVAEILKVNTRQLTERIMKRKGFPRPLNQQVMGSLKRWKKNEIIEWIENGGR